MTSFVLPLTIRTDDGDVDLLVELGGPTRLAGVLPELIARAGLPADSVLHLGVGAVEGSWTLGRAPLLAGCVLRTAPMDAVAEVGPVNLSCVAGPDSGGWISLGGRAVVIGRASGCDLPVSDPELSRRHARIHCGDQGIVITDLGSSYGMRVDGLSQCEHLAAVPVGGLIRLGGSVFRASLDAEPPMLATPDGAGHVVVARPARVAPLFDHQLPPPVGPAPERTSRPIPLLAAIAGAITGAGIAALTGMWTFLLLAALGPVLMLLSALSDRLGGRRSHRRALADYRAASSIESEHLAAAVIADRRDAWDRYPDPATLARRAARCSTRLWERRRDHPDFLVLSLGLGHRPARLQRAARPDVSEVPITFDLAAVGVLGLVGDCRPLIRQLLAQLAALHSPADLQVTIFTEGGEFTGRRGSSRGSAAGDLSRCRDLPHAGVDRAVGMFPTAETAAGEVLRLLTRPGDPVVVVVLDDAAHWRRIPRMNDLLTRAATGKDSLAAICISPTEAALPVECTAIASVQGNLVRFATGSTSVEAEVTGVSRTYLDDMVQALAPLRDPDAPGAGLPIDVLFSSLLGVGPAVDAMADRWQRPCMGTPIGVGVGGPVVVDLEREGPHLLIAGTTGSGKSELLQTVIAGLACAAPPSRTSFLLIDYKGGAAFGRLARLPHTTGVITDLDEALAKRALRSLRAEVRRRERLLALVDAPDLASLRAAGPAPPSLVVVIDEFATLGAELPEFLAGLLDVAQRGRSLGLHLVLATQRPAGVLSPAIKANIGLRICLRVADDTDSIDVVDTVQAARLPADRPGRAVLRRSRSHTTIFQVARVSVLPARGPRVRLRDGKARAPSSGSSRSDLEDVADAADLLSVAGDRPPPPWLPPLPAQLRPDDPAVIGLIDLPDRQSQVPWVSPRGSVMVLGPPASGRSSALRRLARAAAADRADLLVVDAGDGLRDLTDWPSCRTRLTGQDVLLVQRLTTRLTSELRLRTDSPGPPIVLVVDDWELISGPLDALDYGATLAAIADLAGRGPAVGLRVVISGGLQLEHHRMTGAFASVLRMGIGGHGLPGRAVLDADEVQVARCDSGVPAPEPGPLHESRLGPTPRPPIVVRSLPAIVTIRELPPAAVAAVPIGLGGDSAVAQVLDLSGPGGGVLVAGPRRSGVTTALSVLAVGAACAGIRVVRGCLRPAAALAGVQDVDLRAGANGLRQLLVDHQGPIVLIADDADSWPDDATEIMERFVTICGPGQYLAIGCRLDRALRAHRGPIAEVAALRSGILLQADSADGGLLQARLPRRTGPTWPGRGHLVVLGHVTPLQVATL